MEHLPSVENEPVENDPPPLSTPEIFVRPETETTPTPQVTPQATSTPQVTPQVTSTPQAKKKRSYNRDPEEMRLHMANMRSKAIESRRRKKEAKEASKAPQTALAPMPQRGASDFDQFMQHYAKVEEYKAKVANEKADREEFIEAQIEARLAKRRKAEEEESQRQTPLQSDNPFDVYFR